MNGSLFERCLVWMVCQKAAELSPPKNDSELAIEAFKDVANPINAWRSVRNGSKGKFRALSVEEACNLAEAVGTTMDKLCWDVVNHLRNGWSMEQDISLTKGSAGRPKKSETAKSNLFPQTNGSKIEPNSAAIHEVADKIS